MIAGADASGRPQALDGQVIGDRYVSFDAAAGSTLAGPLWAAAMQPVQALLPFTDFWPVPPPVRLPDDASPPPSDPGTWTSATPDGGARSVDP